MDLTTSETVVLAGFILNALVVLVGGSVAAGAMRQRMDDNAESMRARMEDNARTFNAAVCELRQRINVLVTQSECSARHEVAVEAVEGVRREIDGLRPKFHGSQGGL